MLKHWPFAKSYHTKCPDGSIKTVYKNVNDAFPLFIEGWEGKLSSKVKAEDLVNVDANAAYKTKIDGLLFALDDLNQGLMMTFRAVYVTYTTDPCGNSAFLQREVSKLLDEQQRLRTLKLQIDFLLKLAQQHKDGTEEFARLFSDLVQRIGGYPGQEVTVSELKSAADDAKVLLGGA